MRASCFRLKSAEKQREAGEATLRSTAGQDGWTGLGWQRRLKEVTVDLGDRRLLCPEAPWLWILGSEGGWRSRCGGVWPRC